jgi:hypothetical protein
MLKKINNKGQPKNTKFEIYSKREEGEGNVQGRPFSPEARALYIYERKGCVENARGEREGRDMRKSRVY